MRSCPSVGRCGPSRQFLHKASAASCSPRCHRSKTWPAQEIAQQYEQRWHIKTSDRELKQDLLRGELTLRSGTPQTAMQEVWGALLTYNLIRLELAEMTKEEGQAPTDLSFTVALHYMRYEWLSLASVSPGVLPKHLLRLRQGWQSSYCLSNGGDDNAPAL